MSAPPALSASIRLAVSVVTWRHAPMRTPASGLVFAKRSRIWASTGMNVAAHSMRDLPASASATSLTSPRVFSIVCTIVFDFLMAGERRRPCLLKRAETGDRSPFAARRPEFLPGRPPRERNRCIPRPAGVRRPYPGRRQRRDAGRRAGRRAVRDGRPDHRRQRPVRFRTARGAGDRRGGRRAARALRSRAPARRGGVRAGGRRVGAAQGDRRARSARAPRRFKPRSSAQPRRRSPRPG